MKWLTWQLALGALLVLTAAEPAEPADPSAIGDSPPPPPGPPPSGIDAPPAELAGHEPLLPSGRAVVARHFVRLLAQGDYRAAAASYSATGPRPAPDALAATWRELTARLGRLRDTPDTRPAHLYGHDAVRVSCDFTSGSTDIEVAFDDAGHVTGFYLLPPEGQPLSDDLYEPPAYVRRAAFTEHPVQVGSAPWTLPGTVSRPVGDGPFPGVVLVAGSGPQDADEASGPVKPFRDLAWGLASGAIAVLRYDNRRCVYDSQIAAGPDYTVDDEVVDDAVAAIGRLREMPKVDPRRIFVLGHGLAGGLVPRIAARVPGLAGGIILAGWTRPLEDVIVDQAAYLATLQAAGVPAGGTDVEVLRAAATRVKDPAALVAAPAGALLLDRPVAYWQNLAAYRPAEAAARLNLPLLVLQGERDYQVTPADFTGWQNALSGRPMARLKSYPALGHPFLPAEGPPSPDDYQLVNHVPDEVIADLGNWVRAGGRAAAARS